ncbi:ral guanine nucleotide dissociation stimulator-like [Elephas maximus indicus]|uniref:ral guanine nucleotide dissociation stimulator-like n=1 Tax=Elephas maximus indicus TaxID=99487 RepID=UPI0021168D2E|nr:ral guanine nucleotide dissociation stimulator-like [Elephas maximus indicus]XP_049726954.1 ral guanine nucleotide dissociation stimulator-like [Elephas maximus indicus]XP_049726955.1 ral guanine nucleotide dissociation stimulator-like [Elephas maximus indicus]XP_049726956.1 ral guanine nucleotide dissociation stimulator-like [Elephas maximus indicus]XP_049726957.1 ral guanine nucleotide dissociation stimulator-like [Elephas maximus indicus]XP_049726958.1 ral guanine nucleotide dissociation
MKTFKAGSLEKLVELLVPAYLKDDFSYIEIFLGAYRTYATIQQVLEHLLQRYGCNHPYSAEYGEPQEQLKGAISFILGTWLKEYLEDFNQPPDFPCLKLVVEYVYVNMPGSHLEHDTQLLLAQLDQMEVTEAEPEALKPGPAPTAKEAQELTLPQEPAPGQSPGVHSAPVAAPQLHGIPPIMSSAPALAPDRELAERMDPSPGPPPELAPKPLADVNPAPAPVPTLESDGAQVFPQLHHQHQMESQMERWIPIQSHLQNGILDCQLTSILLLLQDRRSTEHQLFHQELQLWQQTGNPLEVHILKRGHRLSRILDHLVMSILILYRHRSSIEHHPAHQQMESPQESWVFTLGNFQNRLKDHFLSQILLLQQHWSWVQQQVQHHQVEHCHLTDSLLKDWIISLGQDHNELLDCLLRSITSLD